MYNNLFEEKNLHIHIRDLVLIKIKKVIAQLLPKLT